MTDTTKLAIATRLRRWADRLDGGLDRAFRAADIESAVYDALREAEESQTRGTLTFTHTGSINDAKRSLERVRRARAVGGASHR